MSKRFGRNQRRRMKLEAEMLLGSLELANRTNASALRRAAEAEEKANKAVDPALQIFMQRSDFIEHVLREIGAALGKSLGGSLQANAPDLLEQLRISSRIKFNARYGMSLPGDEPAVMIRGTIPAIEYNYGFLVTR